MEMMMAGHAVGVISSPNASAFFNYVNHMFMLTILQQKLNDD
jgi:hypothetical protein